MQRLGVTRRHDDVAKRQNHEREHHPCHGNGRACAFRAFPLSPAARRSTRSSTSSRATARSASSRSPKRRCRRPSRKGRHRLSAALYGAVSVTLKNAVGLARIRARWPTEFFLVQSLRTATGLFAKSRPKADAAIPLPAQEGEGSNGDRPRMRPADARIAATGYDEDGGAGNVVAAHMASEGGGGSGVGPERNGGGFHGLIISDVHESK